MKKAADCTDFNGYLKVDMLNWRESSWVFRDNLKKRGYRIGTALRGYFKS
jgi:hypothetical protein